ncbi:MAG: TonB-dependent receptor [Opitutae bacterium]|nr:TonB-dependent receptor [Opitutae bacterium]
MADLRLSISPCRGHFLDFFLRAITTLILFSGLVLVGQEDTDQDEEEIYALDPFTIAEETGQGYSATLSISGTRTRIPIKDLPRSLNVITSEFIEDTDSYTQGEMLEFTSSVTRIHGDGSGDRGDNSIAIRGFEVGAPYRNFFRYRQPIWAINVDRTEVIKGPASTLYGIAGPGGQVNYITKRPLFVKRGSIDAGVGLEARDSYRLIVDYQDVSGQGTDNAIGYRFVGGFQESEGPKDRTAEDHQLYDLSLNLKLSERESLIFEYEFSRFKLIPNGGTPGTETADAQNLIEERFGQSFIDGVEWFTPPELQTQEADQLIFEVFYALPEFTFNNRYDFREVASNLLTFEYHREVFFNWNMNLAYLYNALELDEIDSIDENLKGGLQDPKVGFSPPVEELPMGHLRTGGPWDPFTGTVSQSGRHDLEDIENHALQFTLTGDFELGFLRNTFLVGFSYDSDKRDAMQFETNGVKVNNVQDWKNVNWRGIVGVENADVLRQFPVRDELGMPVIETIVLPGGREFQRPVFEDEPRAFLLEWEDRMAVEQSFQGQAYWITMNSALWDDRIRFVYGMRRDEFTQDIYSVINDRFLFTLDSIVQSKQTQSSDSPQLAFLIQPFSFLGLYGSHSESTIPQFGLWRDQFVDPKDSLPRPPLEGESSEIGLKLNLLDNKISGTFAYFDAKRNNRVASTGSPDRWGAWQRILSDEQAEGYEMDLLLTPLPNWQILLAAAFTDTLQISPRTAEPNQDTSRPIPNISDRQYSAFTKYDFPEGLLSGFSLGGGFNYASDKTWIRSDQIARIRDIHAQPYTIYRLFAGYRWQASDREFNLRLNIRNLSDEFFWINAAQLGEPREARLSLSVDF